MQFSLPFSHSLAGDNDLQKELLQILWYFLKQKEKETLTDLHAMEIMKKVTKCPTCL